MGPVDEGNAFAAAVQQAKEDGKKPGDKFTVDGKEYTLKKEHLSEYASLARYDKDGNKTVTTIDDIDILPRHKRLQHEMAFNDFITTLKALGYDIPEGTLPMEENVDESFDSLVKKVDKEKGYSKKDAQRVAGYIANRKRAGAGKGPTKKMKKREGIKERILKELRG